VGSVVVADYHTIVVVFEAIRFIIYWSSNECYCGPYISDTVLVLVTATNNQQIENSEEYCTNLVSTCNKDFTTRCYHRQYIIKNCCSLKIFKSPTGIYSIRREQFDTADVYCDMGSHGGGWIVIQRNKNGSMVSFNRGWSRYQPGFGNLSGEFWYRLKGISCLTQTGQWEIRLDIQNADKTWTYLHYNNFRVGTASDGYPLTIGGYTLRGTDYFASLNGKKFSTPDVDNDQATGYRVKYHCAAIHQAGWWYYTSCNVINLNKQPPVLAYPKHLLFTEIKIRPKDCISF